MSFVSRALLLFTLSSFLPAASAFAQAEGRSVGSPIRGKQEQRLVSLGVTRSAQVPDDIHRTIDDTFHSQLALASRERGFEDVPLSRVRGLTEQAASCRDPRCRVEVSERVKATHAIRGHLEKHGRAYRLTLFLEDGTSGAFLAGKRMSGDVPALVGELQEKVDALLEEASPKRAAAMARLAKTARAYLEKGRDDDALRTLERAIDISPFHPDGAALQLERVSLIEKSGDEEATFRALLEVLELYGPRSLWTLAGIGQDGAQDRIHLWLRQKLASIGTHNQREAQRLDDKAKNNEAAEIERARRIERAERAYGVYLEEFPDAPDGGELTLYLAELEYARGAYGEAAEHYAAVVDKEGASAELKRQAASSAVYAREQELEGAVARGEVTKLDLAAPLKPLAGQGGLSERERAFVQSIDVLANAFPDAPDAAAFAYRAAQICIFRGDVDEGKRRLADVAKAWPRTKAGRLAGAALKQLP